MTILRTRTVPRWPLVLAAAVLAVLSTAVLALPAARAAAPVDHRGTAPNHPSELPGTGYLLSDPLQGASAAYWAGAYRTVAGSKSYCIDDYYDYPNAAYGYRTSEVRGWPARAGSNNGASGHAAQRIIWIINTYGQASSPKTTAAVSMAINLLTGSAPFQRSYTRYFRPQLLRLNHTIVPSIDKMISDSDHYAGPYRTVLRFGSAPAVGGVGRLAVSIRSARGYVIPNARFHLTSLVGGRLQQSASGSTGPSGSATVRYLALRPGLVSATGYGVSLPNTTMRLALSPSHDTGNFRTGSQRLALVSSTRLRNTGSGGSHTRVSIPVVHTRVIGGTGARTVPTAVSDELGATGLVPSTGYTVRVTLRDASGLSCGRASQGVRADVHGRLALRTKALSVCGGGRDTFSEQILNHLGWVVAVSPPGQPAETFPVSPSLRTAVIGGLGARKAGAPVSDRVQAVGLPDGMDYRVTATLQDASGTRCGTVTGTATSDEQGGLDYTTAPIAACGAVRDTFVEQVADKAGRVLARTTPGQRTETFPLLEVVTTPTPSPSAPSSTPATPTPTPSAPSHESPPTTPPATHPAVTTPAVHRAPPSVTAAPPTPHLAMTGAAPRGLIALGGVGLTIGTLLIWLGLRRRI